MHLYTIIQLICLGVLLGIKFTPAAIGFPFFLAMLIPLRLLGLPKIFTEAEINAVSDSESEDDVDLVTVLQCVYCGLPGYISYELHNNGL